MTIPIQEPITEILGGPNIFLEEGNNLNLTCVVRDSPEPPQYIFWYRNSQVGWLCDPISFHENLLTPHILTFPYNFMEIITGLGLSVYVHWPLNVVKELNQGKIN